ncbi:uncharacterized protein IUM83_02006 [Phytophthora cinnamomi]|uniref:uncharacterized protein n=1 Tax=Phytophthora cinnamomi TaxID=4785 RepID=UPI003559D11E|nr:hypothetical protein IUM83_02006 [Phytophthora cinnamomi]
MTMDAVQSVQFEDGDARGQGYYDGYEEKEEVDRHIKLIAKLLSELEELSLQTVDFGEDPGKFLCPETKKSEMPEKFRSTVGTSYFDDSNMLTPRKVTPSRGRYGPLYDPSDEAELDEDTWDDRGHLDELVKVLIHRLSYDEEEQADTRCLEVRIHFSFDKITEFEGRWYCFEDFIYKMKGTRRP